MSHFSLAVFMNDDYSPESGVDELLENYNEDWSNLDKNLLEFEEVEEDLMVKWEKNEVLQDGKSLKDTYVTFEEFVKQEEGYDERDAVEGVFGRWYNPNARWDWYEIGGRWKDTLYIKGGKKGDCCRIRELDFKAIEKRAFEDSCVFYDKLAKVRRIVDGMEKDNDMYIYDTYDKITAMGLGIFDDSKKLIGVKDISRDKIIEDFIYLFRWSPFAVVDENGWHEKGFMGWFGVADYGSDAKSFLDWHKNFYEKFINQRKKQDFVVIVDCHI